MFTPHFYKVTHVSFMCAIYNFSSTGESFGRSIIYLEPVINTLL